MARGIGSHGLGEGISLSFNTTVSAHTKSRR